MNNTEERRYIERIESPEPLHYVDYYNDTAEIEVPSASLSSMPFDTAASVDVDDYLSAVETIKRSGHDNATPIVLFPRPDGRWEVQDSDAVRFAAVKKVCGDFFSNLFSQRVPKVCFTLRGSSRDGSYIAPRRSFGGGD